MSKVRKRSKGSKSGPAPNGKPAGGRKVVRRKAARISPAQARPPVTIDLTPTVAHYLESDLHAIADDLIQVAALGDLKGILAKCGDMTYIAGKLLEVRGSGRKGGAR
jgi:hypothetical protein